MSDPRVYIAPNPAAERHASVVVPVGAGNRPLWLAVFTPPAAWSVDELAAIAVHHDYCAALIGHAFKPWSGAGVILVVLGLALLAASLWAGMTAWRAHGVLGDDTGLGDTDLDRRRFMARAGLLACGLFSYAILLRTITVFFLGPDRC